MPLFEFVCTQCGQPFEELVRSASVVEGVSCPACGSPKVNKKISKFASKIAGSSGGFSAASSAAACSTGST